MLAAWTPGVESWGAYNGLLRLCGYHRNGGQDLRWPQREGQERAGQVCVGGGGVSNWVVEEWAPQFYFSGSRGMNAAS